MSDAASTPDTAALRRFGLVLAVAFPVLFWLVLPWLFARPRPWWPLVAGAVFAATALVAPRLLAPVERVWLRVGHALGWLNTRILLTLVFFVLLLPLGLVLRAVGKLALPRRPDPGATTYRVPSTRSVDPKAMEKPF